MAAPSTAIRDQPTDRAVRHSDHQHPTRACNPRRARKGRQPLDGARGAGSERVHARAGPAARCPRREFARTAAAGPNGEVVLRDPRGRVGLGRPGG